MGLRTEGAAFIYASQEAQAPHPASISHGYGISNEAIGRSAFHLEYNWTGTQDVTPSRSMAIRLRRIHAGGWTRFELGIENLLWPAALARRQSWYRRSDR